MKSKGNDFIGPQPYVGETQNSVVCIIPKRAARWR